MDASASIARPGRHHNYKPHRRVEEIVKADGFAHFKEYREQTGYNATELVPSDESEFPYLTFSPYDAFGFLRNSSLEFNRFSIEKHYKSNRIPYLNMWSIKGFDQYYEQFQSYDKFEMAGKKAEVVAALGKAQEPYEKEYGKYVRSVFILTPFKDLKELFEDNYDVDKATLTLSASDDNIVTGDTYYGVSSPGRCRGKDWFGNVPRAGNVKLSLPVARAAELFKRKPLFYDSVVYVSVNSTLECDVQPFEHKAILYRIFDESGQEQLLFLLHDFKQVSLKVTLGLTQVPKFEWKTEMIEADASTSTGSANAVGARP